MNVLLPYYTVGVATGDRRGLLYLCILDPHLYKGISPSRSHYSTYYGEGSLRNWIVVEP